MTDVFVDGRLIGEVEKPSDFVKKVIKARRLGKIDSQMNVHFDESKDSIDIFFCEDRLRRPLIIVENGEPALKAEHLEKLKKGEMSWSDLLKQHMIEYLDSCEEENSLIATSEEELTKDHTHLEIDLISIFGVSGSLVPYANFSPSARLLRGQKTQKQGTSFYSLNYPLRTDTNIDILHHPQRSIVGTFMQDLVGPEKAVGQNLIVAVMNFEGYNMDDAIVLNRQSLQRCVGRSTHFQPYVVEKKRYYGGQTDDILVPDKEAQGYTTEEDYRFLTSDGIVYKEAEVKAGETVVGRTSPPRFLSKLGAFSTAANIRKDTSIRIRHGEEGLAGDILLTESEEGNLLIKVKMRDPRTVEIGDKFSTRSGQKGVIGMIVDAKDMPFTADGMVPDLIFSPNSLVKRMTMNYMLEIIGGKTGAMGGRYIDGTTFSSEDSDSIQKELLNLGFREDGSETLYDGRTGKQYSARIFIGSLYYLRLYHQVRDKIQSRARGPVQLLTHQPTEGKAKEGGTRFGEMEKETLVGHGASLLLKERFDSDKTIIYICSKCGDVAMFDYYKNKAVCEACAGKSKAYPIEMSYAFKLFLDELKSLYIRPILILEDKY